MNLQLVRRGVEDLTGLVEIGLGVAFDVVGIQHRTRLVLAGRIADERGVVADDEHGFVAEVLELPEFAQDNAVAEMQVGRGGVATEFDAQGLAGLEFLEQLLARDDGLTAGSQQV